MTTIRYFIPEDGDLEAQPNVFLAPKPRQQGYPVTLGQVKQAFPLPGRYHFRFKSPVVPGTDQEKGALAVWMDCTDDSQPVLTWKSQIIAKVTRTGVEEDDDDDDDDEDFRRPLNQQQSTPPVQQHPPQQQQQQQQQRQPAPAPTPPAPAKQPSFDLFDAGPAPAAPAAGVVTGDLLGGHHHQHQPVATNTGSLLDMNFHQHQTPSPPQQHAHADFFGMTSGPSPPVSGNMNNLGHQQQQPPPPQRAAQKQQMNKNNRSGSFDSFGSHGQGGQGGDAFSGLGTPW